MTFTKSYLSIWKIFYPSRCFDVQDIGLFIPWPLIELNVMSIFFEHKWTIFIQHTHQARTARTSIKPPVNWISIRITLWLKVNIMITTCVKLQISWLIHEKNTWIPSMIIISRNWVMNNILCWSCENNQDKWEKNKEISHALYTITLFNMRISFLDNWFSLREFSFYCSTFCC